MGETDTSRRYDSDTVMGAGQPACSGMRDTPRLRVAEGYAGKTVLLTGATGYLGSLILEQLFRTCPGIGKVFVVVRPKRGVTPAERLAALLRGPVFHLLREHVAEVAARIELVEADIEKPGFGLSRAQRMKLTSDVDFIIHCAATIRFDLPVKAVLRANFLPTRALLDFAATLPRLRAFTFMSTAYVNAYLPQGSLIEEKIYPLIVPAPRPPAPSMASGCLGGVRVAEGVSGLDSDAESVAEEGHTGRGSDGAGLPAVGLVRRRSRPAVVSSGVEIDGLELAETLLAMAPEDAEKEAARIMKATGIQNTYFLVKNLTERMVMMYRNNPFPLCIVRPTIVTGVARAPYPGFVGNTSGLTGALLATAVGIVRFAQHDAKSVVAMVPGDLVSSATLAATIATAEACPGVGPIVQVCTSTTFPVHALLLHTTCCEYLNAHPPKALGKHACSTYRVDFVKSNAAFRARCLAHSIRVGSMCAMLRLAKEAKVAKKLSLGWGVWKQLGSKAHDYNLSFATGSAQALQAALGPKEAVDIKCVFRVDLGDDWPRYLKTYGAAVLYQYLREPASSRFEDNDFAAVLDAPGLEIFPPVKAAAPASAKVVEIAAEDALKSNASSIDVAEAVEKAVAVSVI